VRDLLAQPGHARYVAGPANDKGELPRALMPFDPADPLRWAVCCDDELRRVTQGWQDICVLAHACLGRTAALATLARSVLGVSLDSAKAQDQRGRWDLVTLSPAQLRYAAGDAVVTLLCAQKLCAPGGVP
jgi:hypothetical protein